jgi:YaiO family outer membrane protein
LKFLPKNFSFVLLALAFSAASAIAETAANDTLEKASFTEVATGTTRETLSSNAPDWTNTHLSIIHQFAARQSLGLDIARVSRFGLSDETLTLSAYAPTGSKSTLFFEAIKSRDHSFLARDSVHAQLLQSFDEGFGAALGVRHARYENSNVTIGEITIEKYFSNYRAAFSVLPSHSTSAGNATSYRAAFAYYYGERSNVQIAAARGTELERTSALLPIVATDVRSVTLYGRHAFDNAWAFDYALGRSTRANVTHHEFSVGARFRFK